MKWLTCLSFNLLVAISSKNVLVFEGGYMKKKWLSKKPKLRCQQSIYRKIPKIVKITFTFFMNFKHSSLFDFPVHINGFKITCLMWIEKNLLFTGCKKWWSPSFLSNRGSMLLLVSSKNLLTSDTGPNLCCGLHALYNKILCFIFQDLDYFFQKNCSRRKSYDQ